MRPSHESIKEQLQTTTKSRILSSSHRANLPTSKDQLHRVGWPAKNLIHQKEQDSGCNLQTKENSKNVVG
jgi:hypothetical protein